MAKRTIEVYEDTTGEWRWRSRSSINGNITAVSAQGYKKRASAIQAARQEYFTELQFVFVWDDRLYNHKEHGVREPSRFLTGSSTPKGEKKSA